jgi:hypothetical protein
MRWLLAAGAAAIVALSTVHAAAAPKAAVEYEPATEGDVSFASMSVTQAIMLCLQHTAQGVRSWWACKQRPP